MTELEVMQAYGDAVASMACERRAVDRAIAERTMLVRGQVARGFTMSPDADVWQQRTLSGLPMATDVADASCSHRATEVEPRIFDAGYDLVCVACGATVDSDPGTMPGEVTR